MVTWEFDGVKDGFLVVMNRNGLTPLLISKVRVTAATAHAQLFEDEIIPRFEILLKSSFRGVFIVHPHYPNVTQLLDVGAEVRVINSEGSPSFVDVTMHVYALLRELLEAYNPTDYRDVLYSLCVELDVGAQTYRHFLTPEEIHGGIEIAGLKTVAWPLPIRLHLESADVRILIVNLIKKVKATYPIIKVGKVDPEHANLARPAYIRATNVKVNPIKVGDFVVITSKVDPIVGIVLREHTELLSDLNRAWHRDAREFELYAELNAIPLQVKSYK